jgi:mRNA interferase RelE/StbE
MTWQIEFDRRAHKEFQRLDRPARERILRFLTERIEPSTDPRSLAEPLAGDAFAGLWRFRVGDYRLIAHFEDEVFLVLILRIGHRRAVYR